MCISVSYDTFEKGCKCCEFHEYERVTYRHYCHKDKILESHKFNIFNTRKRIIVKENGDEICEWQELKKQSKRDYDVIIYDKENVVNHSYAITINKNLTSEDERKLRSFAEGLKIAYPDFYYNENNLTKELIEGFLKGKIIKKAKDEK